MKKKRGRKSKAEKAALQAKSDTNYTLMFPMAAFRCPPF